MLDQKESASTSVRALARALNDKEPDARAHKRLLVGMGSAYLGLAQVRYCSSWPGAQTRQNVRWRCNRNRNALLRAVYRAGKSSVT